MFEAYKKRNRLLIFEGSQNPVEYFQSKGLDMKDFERLELNDPLDMSLPMGVEWDIKESELVDPLIKSGIE